MKGNEWKKNSEGNSVKNCLKGGGNRKERVGKDNPLIIFNIGPN